MVHYFVYRADYRLHLLSNKVNPFRLIFKLPFVKRSFERSGQDPMDVVNEAWRRPDVGLSSMVAGAAKVLLVFLLCVGLEHTYSAIARGSLGLKLYHYFALGAMSYIVNHFLLFRRDKYLAYFKEFDKMPEKERRKWAWISLATVAGIILFAVGSFVLMDYRI